MLFCSQPFLVFFTWVFAGYWAMERCWPRLAVLAAGAFFFLRGTWKALDAWRTAVASLPPSASSFDHLGSALAFQGAGYVTAGIVAVAVAASLKVGHQRGR